MKKESQENQEEKYPNPRTLTESPEDHSKDCKENGEIEPKVAHEQASSPSMEKNLNSERPENVEYDVLNHSPAYRETSSDKPNSEIAPEHRNGRPNSIEKQDLKEASGPSTGTPPESSKSDDAEKTFSGKVQLSSADKKSSYGVNSIFGTTENKIFTDWRSRTPTKMIRKIARSFVDAAVDEALIKAYDESPGPSTTMPSLRNSVEVKYSGVTMGSQFTRSQSSGLSKLNRPWICRNIRKLEQHNFETFVLFEFQSPNSDISVFFLLYKYLHSVLMTILLVLSFVMGRPSHWLIFLCNWCLALGTAEALWGTFLVNYYYYNLRTKSLRGEAIDGGLETHTNLYAIAHSASLTITLATFAAMSTLKGVFSIEVPSFHRLVAASGLMVIKIFVERYPYPFAHVFFSFVFFTLFFICVSLYGLTEYAGEEVEEELKGLFMWDWKDLGATLKLVGLSYAILLGVHVILYALLSAKKIISFKLVGVPGRPKERIKKRRRRRSMFSDVDVQVQMERLQKGARVSRSRNTCQVIFELICSYEEYSRRGMRTFEWQLSPEADITLYLVLYRLFQVVIYVGVVLKSFFEPERERQSSEYYMKWILYWDHTFLVFSLFQATFGLVLTYRFYRRRHVELKYYQKSANYVTLPQKFYSAVFSAAFTLAVFLTVTHEFLRRPSPVIILGIPEYDIVVLINLLLLLVDFVLIAIPFKIVFSLVAILIFSVNLMLNAMAYGSSIGGRDGKKYIYENLPWGDPKRVSVNVFCLYVILILIHFVLWILFIFKRNLSHYLKMKLIKMDRVEQSVPNT